MGRNLLSATCLLALAACSGQADTGSRSQVEANSATANSRAPANYRMALSAVPVSATAIRFTVETNLPLPVQVAASVGLAGQADDETFIGHDQFVTLDRPTTTFVLDVSRAQRPLPAGQYEAEVAFYPRWGAEGNQAASQAPELRATDRIRLAGSGQSAQDARLRNERQRWVMSSTSMNMPWDEQLYVRRLGPFQKSQAELSPLHDAYYFPGADMTLIVNRVQNELTIWRMGRESR